MKKVSIIVPVYNVEKYIDRCLESLVNQTLDDIEIIVVNDGSPDNSQKKINKYVKKYPNKVFSYIKENGGLGSARNYGIKKAHGEFLAFVDSDDYVTIDMFEKMYNKAIASDLEVVICGNYIVDENYKILKEEFPKECSYCNNNFKYILSGNVCVWNKIYLTDLIKKNGLEFRTNIWYEDIDFSSKVCAITEKIDVIDECFYYYLIRQGSIMNNSKINKNLDILLSFDEIINYFSKNNIYDKYIKEIEFLAIYHIYITAIVRVNNINCSIKEKSEIIKKLNNYVCNNFRNFKKNIYIKNLDKNKKIIYNLVRFKQYLLIKFIFKFKNRIEDSNEKIN